MSQLHKYRGMGVLSTKMRVYLYTPLIEDRAGSVEETGFQFPSGKYCSCKAGSL